MSSTDKNKADTVCGSTSYSNPYAGTSTIVSDNTWSFAPETTQKPLTVQTLENLIDERKKSVMDKIERNISEDLDEDMGKEIAKKIIIKFGIDIDELRAEIVTEEI